jgi:SulP family sulfate permease
VPDQRQDRGGWLRRAPTRGDVVAGISVGLVLVPQSFAYATLAGMPPERGLLVAVAATLAAAPFASSPFLQTGPVAITALLTFGALQGLAPTGGPEFVALGMMLALLVGLIRLTIGLLGEGAMAYLLSRPVLAGFTPAAALVIAASQVPLALGSDAQGQIMLRAARAMVDVGSWDPMTLAFAVASTVGLWLGTRRWPLFPSVLVVVVAGIVLARATSYAGAVVGEVPGISFVAAFDLPLQRLNALLVPALIIAVVGFGDAAAVARNYAAETRTRWDANREFVSQGAANIASGLVGGFPAGGSFSRSAIGRLAGAQTTWAGALSGLVALAFVPFINVLADLPIAVLSGIIVASVATLLPARELRELRGLSRPQFRIAGITALLTVILAPAIQWALMVGVALAIGWHLRRETLISISTWTQGSTLHLRPSGVLYFGSAHTIRESFQSLLARDPDVDAFVLHLDRLGRMDVSGALELRDLVDEAERAGVRASLTDLVPASQKILQRVLGASISTVSASSPDVED